MEISISIEQGKVPIAVMKIKGDMDAWNFMEVVDKAQEIYNNPARDLVIDLSEVPSISSTGQVAIHKIALIYSGVPQQWRRTKTRISRTAVSPVNTSNCSTRNPQWMRLLRKRD